MQNKNARKTANITRSDNYKKLINCQKWVNLRAEKLRNNPLCEHCFAKNIVNPGTEIHHLQPIDTGANFETMKQLAYNYTNIVTLCHKCHIQAHIDLKSKTKETTKNRNDIKTSGFVEQFLQKNNSPKLIRERKN